MKKTTNTFSLLGITLLAMLAIGCGTEGTTPTTLPNTSLNFDFRVTSSSPVNGSSNINASNENVQIYFSENIDSATALTNVILRKETGGSTQTLTPGTDYEIIPIGNMVDITIKDGTNAAAGLQENSTYYVVLLPGLTSSTNNQLYEGQYPQGVQVSFHTGVGYGNSVPGSPKVQSIDKFNNFNGCFTAIVRFNEDVSLFFNDITVFSAALFNTGGGLINTTIYPYYTSRQDVWVVDAQGCSLLGVSAFLQEITVTVEDAVDLEGNHLEPSPDNSDTF